MMGGLVGVVLAVFAVRARPPGSPAHLSFPTGTPAPPACDEQTIEPGSPASCSGNGFVLAGRRG